MTTEREPTEEEAHALFDHVVMACPAPTGENDAPCGHEYDAEELETWQEASVDGWWGGCPECHAAADPKPARVNRLDQYTEARVELEETIAFIAERMPDLRPRLDRALAEADERIARILATV